MNNDKRLEITTVRLGTAFIGFLVAKTVDASGSASIREFLPVYLSSLLLIYALFKNGLDLKETKDFASKNFGSFLANLGLILIPGSIFLLGQSILLLDFRVPDHWLPSFRDTRSILTASLVCGGLSFHLLANLFYRDLKRGFKIETIDKYIVAPCDGWTIGIL